MSERQDHGKNLSGKDRIKLCAKSFISQVYDLLARHTSLAELQHAVLEFHDLVGTYVNLCATAVFGRLPQDLSAAMNPRAKTELAAFRQISFRFGTVTQRDQPIASVSEAAAVFLCASEAFALREQFLSVHARVARAQFGPFRKPPVKHMLTCKRHQ
jgi:hypothetical protein